MNKRELLVLVLPMEIHIISHFENVTKALFLEFVFFIIFSQIKFLSLSKFMINITTNVVFKTGDIVVTKINFKSS